VESIDADALEYLSMTGVVIAHQKMLRTNPTMLPHSADTLKTAARMFTATAATPAGIAPTPATGTAAMACAAIVVSATCRGATATKRVPAVVKFFDIVFLLPPASVIFAVTLYVPGIAYSWN